MLYSVRVLEAVCQRVQRLTRKVLLCDEYFSRSPNPSSRGDPWSIPVSSGRCRVQSSASLTSFLGEEALIRGG